MANELIKTSEGFRSDAYWDPHGGVWTIGYGTTKYSDGSSVKPGDTISKKDADKALQSYLDNNQGIVDKYANQYGWNSNQREAINSFVYNLGPGALNQLTANGTRSNAEIAKKILLYVKAGGETLAGLVTRRQKEATLFNQGGEGPTPEQTFYDPETNTFKPGTEAQKEAVRTDRPKADYVKTTTPDSQKSTRSGNGWNPTFKPTEAGLANATAYEKLRNSNDGGIVLNMADGGCVERKVKNMCDGGVV